MTIIGMMTLEGLTCSAEDCEEPSAVYLRYGVGHGEGCGLLPACEGHLVDMLAVATAKHKAWCEEQRETSEKVVMPAGLYYIGDPYYVLSEERQAELHDAMFRNPDGSRNPDGISPAALTSQGLSMMAMHTGGAGGYRDNEGYKYEVEIGTIAAIQLAGASLLKLNSESPAYDTQVSGRFSNARLHLFTEDFACYWDSQGWLALDLYFGDIVIHIGDEE